MRILRWYAILALFVAGGAAISAQSEDRDKSAQFSVSIRPLENKVKVGQPTTIEVTIKNMSDKVMIVPRDPRFVYWLFAFDVRDDVDNPSLTRVGKITFGIEKPRTGEGPALIPEGGQPNFVDPGKTLVMKIAIPDIFDLSRPGTYTVQVKLPDGPQTKIKSNKVTVTIIP